MFKLIRNLIGLFLFLLGIGHLTLKFIFSIILSAFFLSVIWILYELTQVISEPTRITESTSTLIDLI